jgi:glucokinase
MNFRGANNGLLLGFDIGGTKCAVVLGSEEGHQPVVLAREAFATLPGPEANLDRMLAIASRLLVEKGHGPARAVGISCGGPLDSKSGRVFSPPNLPGWDDVPVADIVSGALGLPAQLENDANACALAEWMWGAGIGTSNMAFLTCGTGMGAGLILDGRLYRGACDLAGEIGHVRIAPDGPDCHGKAGSFEGLCSGAGISRLASSLAGWPPGTAASEVFAAAAAGDRDARRVVETAGDALGCGIALLIDILNLEAVVVGSIFARQENLLRPAMEAAIAREALPRAAAACRVLPARLGDAVGDFAALAIAKLAHTNPSASP